MKWPREETEKQILSCWQLDNHKKKRAAGRARLLRKPLHGWKTKTKKGLNTRITRKKKKKKKKKKQPLGKRRVDSTSQFLFYLDERTTYSSESLYILYVAAHSLQICACWKLSRADYMSNTFEKKKKNNRIKRRMNNNEKRYKREKNHKNNRWMLNEVSEPLLYLFRWDIYTERVSEREGWKGSFPSYIAFLFRTKSFLTFFSFFFPIYLMINFVLGTCATVIVET